MSSFFENYVHADILFCSRIRDFLTQPSTSWEKSSGTEPGSTGEKKMEWDFYGILCVSFCNAAARVRRYRSARPHPLLPPATPTTTRVKNPTKQGQHAGGRNGFPIQYFRQKTRLARIKEPRSVEPKKVANLVRKYRKQVDLV